MANPTTIIVYMFHISALEPVLVTHFKSCPTICIRISWWLLTTQSQWLLSHLVRPTKLVYAIDRIKQHSISMAK